MRTFEKIDTIDLPELRLRFDHYVESVTGATHYHLTPYDEVSEMAISIYIRTAPTDSTGVAHILEHSVFCGSQRYPVRDPFASMRRRSLFTFMNAMTGAAWTQYPFATQNSKDFFNLLSVYQDAVFFPLLEPEVFAQEGHRLEFEDPYDATTPLTCNGVVYNEMIGSLGSAIADIRHKMAAHLYPNTTYSNNYAGDPKVIPELTYEQLLRFHQEHYHPSNATYVSFGKIPIKELHSQIAEQVLAQFDGRRSPLILPVERTLLEPTSVVERYAYDDDSDTDQRTHHIVGWILGQSGCTDERLEARLLTRALIGNSAAPLRRFLDKYPHGTAPSSLNGLHTAAARMALKVGVEGSDPEYAEDFEKALLIALEGLAEEGVSPSLLASQCHQMELRQREVKGALGNLYRLLPVVVYGSDPRGTLDIGTALDRVHEQIQDPSYIKKLIRTQLLENPHRLRFSAVPDSNLSAEKAAQKQQKLAAIQRQLTPEQTSAIVEGAKALEARQRRVDDPDLLPKLSLRDIPPEVARPTPSYQSAAVAAVLKVDDDTQVHVPACTIYPAMTNGISYVRVVSPLPQLTDDERSLFSTYRSLLTVLGVNGADYVEMLERQAAVTGGISCTSSVAPGLHCRDTLTGYFSVVTKALNRNLEAAVDLMREIVAGVRFDEVERIQELVKKRRLAAEQGLTKRGASPRCSCRW